MSGEIGGRELLVWTACAQLLIVVIAVIATPWACVEPPRPHPSPAPTATPAPTPTPCVIPATWESVEGIAPQLVPAVRGSMDALGPAPGPTPEDSLDALARDLVRRGYCAGRQADAVMVQRSDGLFEEHHAVAFGTGQWIATPFRAVWKYRA